MITSGQKRKKVIRKRNARLKKETDICTDFYEAGLKGLRSTTRICRRSTEPSKKLTNHMGTLEATMWFVVLYYVIGLVYFVEVTFEVPSSNSADLIPLRSTLGYSPVKAATADARRPTKIQPLLVDSLGDEPRVHRYSTLLRVPSIPKHSSRSRVVRSAGPSFSLSCYRPPRWARSTYHRRKPCTF